MIARRLQWFCVFLLCLLALRASADELKPGSFHALSFTDVDGNRFSTADGHITVITVVTRSNEEKAHAVADQVPDEYMGNPKCRYVTLVNFQGKLAGFLQGLTRTIIRGRLDSEAKRLKPEYEAKHLARDPRKDMHVIADFDGKAVAQLGLPMSSDQVMVFLFNGRGKLIQRWTDVPPDDSLGKAIAAAR